MCLFQGKRHGKAPDEPPKSPKKGRAGDAKQVSAAPVFSYGEETAQLSAAKTHVLRSGGGTALTLLRRPRHICAAVVDFFKFFGNGGTGL